MRAFWDPGQLEHAPQQELHNGAFVPFAETPARAQAILKALGRTEPSIDHGEEPLLRVHSADYLHFLKNAHRLWREAGRKGDASGYVWPVVRRRSLELQRIDAQLGQFSYDASTPVAEGTWAGVYAGAQTALTALDAVLGGDKSAFALCRPPGHHCGADYMGGYCYLNNAAVAAEAALAAGRNRVAILDVDYHHGNGTQDTFYERGDVFFASIHADPRTDYPFYWGHADEIGEGPGAGATLNLPLARGATITQFEPALRKAMESIAAFGPDLLIVSYGADTFVDDPISYFSLTTADYTRVAKIIASAGYPALIVMEGGYAVGELGENVAAFLAGF